MPFYLQAYLFVLGYCLLFAVPILMAKGWQDITHTGSFGLTKVEPTPDDVRDWLKEMGFFVLLSFVWPIAAAAGILWLIFGKFLKWIVKVVRLARTKS